MPEIPPSGGAVPGNSLQIIPETGEWEVKKPSEIVKGNFETDHPFTTTTSVSFDYLRTVGKDSSRFNLLSQAGMVKDSQVFEAHLDTYESDKTAKAEATIDVSNVDNLKMNVGVKIHTGNYGSEEGHAYLRVDGTQIAGTSVGQNADYEDKSTYTLDVSSKDQITMEVDLREYERNASYSGAGAAIEIDYMRENFSKRTVVDEGWN